VLCSQGFADKVSLVEDEQGNVALNLDEIVGHPKDCCGNVLCMKPNCEMNCARCHRIAYCSKECQRLDWRRHKNAECVQKKKSGRFELVSVDTDAVEKAEAAAERKIMDTITAGALPAKIEAWGKYREEFEQGKAFSLAEPISDFLIRCHMAISSLAAVHIAQYPHLKGALFLFTKVSIYDLVDEPSSKKLDQSFTLAWGCRYDKSAGDSHPRFSVLDLGGKFLDRIKTLPDRIESCCDKTNFPLVICSDPSGSLLPDGLESCVPPPSCVDLIDYIHGSPIFTTVCLTRFLDFDASLELGRQQPEQDISLCNLDRNIDEPSSRPELF